MTVLAFAGRRVDAPDAETARFPSTNVIRVATAIHAKLEELHATVLVSSAAAGADLLALQEAGALGLRRRIVLPVPPAQFVAASVADRPGTWVLLFEGVVADVEGAGDLVVLNAGDGEEGYAAATVSIVAEARALAAQSGREAAALIAWDGHPRGSTDFTAAFAQHARREGLTVHEVFTK